MKNCDDNEFAVVLTDGKFSSIVTAGILIGWREGGLTVTPQRSLKRFFMYAATA